MVQVLSGPACAGEQLLSFEHYRGSARREAFYSRMLWAIDLIRGFHQRILSMAGEVTGAASSVFYLPSFFGLLIALQDEESLRCLIQASATITQSSLYWRNLGYDHFYVHGMEYPVVTDFDFAWGKPQARDEAKLWIVQAFYASTRNMAILTTGELSHGLVSTLAANLYTMRRVVNIPFMLRDGVEELEERRRFRLSFAGSVQAHNFERVLFLRAAAAEFPPLVNGSIWTVSNPKLQLKALVQLNASEPLDHTQRGACFQRRWLKWLYRRSELCVCAPGDAPALGQRLADVVAAGCIPVVLAGPGTVPVLPLQGAVRWEDFAVILRLGDDVSSTRWALRRLWALSQKEIQRRRRRLRSWRRGLAITGQRDDAAELALREVLSAQAVWRRQLPFGSLEMNSSACAGQRRGPPPEGLASRCGIAERLLPKWG